MMFTRKSTSLADTQTSCLSILCRQAIAIFQAGCALQTIRALQTSRILPSPEFRNWHFILVLGFFCSLAVGTFPGEASLCAQESADLKKDAPKFAKALMENDLLEIRFYDPATEPRKFLGETRFDLDCIYKFKFKAKTTQRGRTRKAGIRVTFTQVKVVCKSTVYLPKSYENKDDFWSTKLVRHEMEHVRINSDPRITLLIEFLTKMNTRFEVQLSSNESVNNESVKELLDDRTRLRREAVNSLIQFNHDDLDKVTGHGGTGKIEESFFAQLFTKKNIENGKFEYSRTVARYLGSTKYQKAFEKAFEAAAGYK